MLAYEDFEPEMEIAFGTYAVTAEEISHYSDLYQPESLVTGEGCEAARETNVTSGWHVAAMCMRLMCDSFILKSTSQGAPGVDYLKWEHPVFEGDILTGKAIVLSKRVSRSRPGLGFVQIRSEFVNQHGHTVCTMENAGIMGMRHAGGSHG